MSNPIKLLICFVLIFVFRSEFFSQGQNEIIQNRIEFISEQMESEDLDLTDVIESLNYYYERKLNLNQATASELRSLQLLTDVQINDLLLHIKRFGKLISIYELQSLKYWDLQTVQFVLPFVQVDDRLDQVHLSFKEVLKYGKFDWFMRYQRVPEHKKGYDNVSMDEKMQSSKYYYGNPDRYYTRLKYSYRNNLSLGFTAEKDPGEKFFKGSQKRGFDFYSMHLYYNGGKYLRTFVIGDYQVQIGQGLNLWTGYAFRKTADVTNIKRSALPIKAYSSVDESRFLRGVATVVGYKKWSLLLFGSHKRVDGSSALSDTLAEEAELITSINLMGLHRTTGELARRKSIRETIAGANAKYTSRNFSAGIAAVYQGYDKEFLRDEKPYNQYDFSGSNKISLSVDYNYVWKNINLFGEAALAGHKNQYAVLQGILWSLDPRVTFSAFYRNYSRGYSAFYNNGMGEWAKAQNEEGIYLGLKTKISDAWTVNTYFDLFQRKWLSYMVDAPSRGHEFLFQVNYKPNKKMEIYARYRQQLKQKNTTASDDGSITEIINQDQRNYRLNFSYQVTESIQLKSRIEYVTFETERLNKDHGWLVQQDVIFRPKRFPVDLSVRYALFDTDSYYSRIYSFENNALYTYSIPAYYYQGSRAYFVLRYSFLKHFDLWVKYGQFLYANRNSLGSGSEEIRGNTRSDITIQLRIKI